MTKEKNGDKHSAIIEKFNVVVDITSSFVKSIFPQTIRFIVGIKSIFSKKEKSPENQ